MKPEGTVRDVESRKQEIIDFVSKSLMTMWFAGKTPRDEHKWLDIARLDAVGVVNSLADAGMLNLDFDSESRKR